MNADELALVVGLARSVAPKVLFEFGCNRGETSKALLDNLPTLERLIGVDVPFGTQTALSCQLNEVPAIPGMYSAGDPRFWLLVQERGTLALGPQDLEPCDAVFIDGDHGHQAVMHDSHLARALTRPGGIILWHDWHNESVEVTEVLEQLSNQGWPIKGIQGTWLAFLSV
jgi:predicted O-methyltransferase YrrM